MRKLFTAAALAAILAAPAMAHRQWLLPSTTIVSGTEEWVTVDGAISNDLFYPDHFPLPTDGVKVWAPDGTPGQIQNAATGRYRSTFDVKLDKPGTWKIGTESDAVMGTFKLNGEEWRVGGRRRPPQPGAPANAAPPRQVAGIADIPAGATDVKLTEVVNRNMIFVTAGAPTETVFTPSGKGLEMQPVTHPGALVADEPAKLRFLIDGKPAANLKVTVVPGTKKFRASEEVREVTTGADGVATIAWPLAGWYWVNATATDTKPSVARATERRMSYTTTLEVLAP